MKIAIGQINPSVGNFKTNKEKILKYVIDSKKLSPDIIVFPELSICGYPPLDLIWEKNFIKENLNSLNEIASISNIPIIIGCIRSQGNNFYNSAAVCFNGKVQTYCDKMLLPTYDVFDEKRYFSSGEKPKVVLVPINGEYKKIGVQICEDLWDEDYPCKVSDIQKDLGANLIINISASPYYENRKKERKDYIISKTGQIKLPFIYCNMVGAQDELIFDGSSCAFTKEGKLIAQCKSFEEDLIMVNLEEDKAIKFSMYNREEEIYRALCLGVNDYFIKTGHSKAAVGLSGGIDSALVATIATEALGKENVCGISLPSRFSSQHSLTDAKELAINLGIDYRVIKTHTIIKSFEATLKDSFKDKKPNVAEENIQSRVRGNILMALANKFGWLVLSTGNKTELALGYCTLYGDMVGALSVISDLSKNDVYSISKWINKNRQNCIPLNSIDKPPSAELAPNQVDPFDYSIVSPLIDEIVEKRKSISQLINKGYSEDLVYDVYKKIKINEYKRRQAPPGLRVSSKAFGVGRRLPIVNNFNG